MALLELLTYPDERLKQLSQTVESFEAGLQQFLTDLTDTMLSGPGGIGIAAPQVANFQRIVIVDCSLTRKPVPNHGRLLIINPEIIAWEGMASGREGCMSVPDFTGNVIRAEAITLSYQDAKGQKQQLDAEGYEARAIQHEIDHLDGKLFLDRLVSRHNDLFSRKVYQNNKAKKPAA
ncbi:MAG: peptide deformylase [Thiohalomonadaceae bacterium]